MGTLEKAFGYQGDKMNLPVRNIDEALPFYERVLACATGLASVSYCSIRLK